MIDSPGGQLKAVSNILWPSTGLAVIFCLWSRTWSNIQCVKVEAGKKIMGPNTVYIYIYCIYLHIYCLMKLISAQWF